MTMASKTSQEQATHVENGPPRPASGAEIILDDHAVGLDADELRDQMAAQIKRHKLSFMSKSSLQLFFYFFVVYCSESPAGRLAVHIHVR